MLEGESIQGTLAPEQHPLLLGQILFNGLVEQ